MSGASRLVDHPIIAVLFKVMVCQLVYSIMPWSEFSQPTPDSLCPPKA
jgi:hypothetical protein